MIFAAVALVGCHAGNKKNASKAKAIAEFKAAAEAKAAADWKVIEKAIRKSLKKPTGELTKADLEKVWLLNLSSLQLTKIPRGLKKLPQLTYLHLENNPGLTRDQVDKLRRALPRCRISH